MKKIFTIVTFLICLNLLSYSQTFQGTIKVGTQPNSVILAIKSSGTFSGPITNVEFMVELDSSLHPTPSTVIFNNLLAANVPTANYTSGGSPLLSNDSSFYNYLYNANI